MSCRYLVQLFVSLYKDSGSFSASFITSPFVCRSAITLDRTPSSNALSSSSALGAPTRFRESTVSSAYENCFHCEWRALLSLSVYLNVSAQPVMNLCVIALTYTLPWAFSLVTSSVERGGRVMSRIDPALRLSSNSVLVMVIWIFNWKGKDIHHPVQVERSHPTSLVVKRPLGVPNVSNRAGTGCISRILLRLQLGSRGSDSPRSRQCLHADG